MRKLGHRQIPKSLSEPSATRKIPEERRDLILLRRLREELPVILVWTIQTNGADGFRLALIRISDKLNGLDACIVHTQQHDEIIVEVRDAIEDQVQAIVK